MDVGSGSLLQRLAARGVLSKASGEEQTLQTTVARHSLPGPGSSSSGTDSSTARISTGGTAQAQKCVEVPTHPDAPVHDSLPASASPLQTEVSAGSLPSRTAAPLDVPSPHGRR